MKDHAQCEMSGTIEGLFAQIHVMDMKTFYLLSAAYCKELSAHVEGPYRDVYTVFAKKMNDRGDLHKTMSRSRDEMASVLNCWFGHPEMKGQQVNQFAAAAVAQLCQEMAIISIAKDNDVLSEHEYILLTQYWVEVMGIIPEPAPSEIPSGFLNAFKLYETTGTGNQDGSREVQEFSRGIEINTGRATFEYTVDPSD